MGDLVEAALIFLLSVGLWAAYKNFEYLEKRVEKLEKKND